MKNIFENKVIMVTGGCGSIGSEIIAQLLRYNPDSIRVFDNNEEGHFRLQQKHNTIIIRSLIGDVRDKERLKRAMEGVDIVFHAAALKHVPLCEYNPFEAVSTNVVGTENVVSAAGDCGVARVVTISTDKAVNPINTMGATKLLAEKIATKPPVYKPDVKFCSVRFGNVLNSSGSVIPIFKNQIKQGGPITITSNDMTRFFMSISEAVHLVLKASEIMEGGETFVLKMKALKIIDLARALVEELAPKYNFNPKEIEFKIIGVRPGEKIHESLMTEEESLYMEETNEMLIIKDSILAKSNVNKPVLNNVVKTYNSGKLTLLTFDEIKSLLKNKYNLC